ncbi:MAG: DUF4338 domain-containing protein [Opitutaceae bacterium]|nr:DUF4338 domain-containing protein [Opitutaceae bacterium]
MATVKAFTIGARIKRDLRNHLRDLGFTKKADGSLNPPSGDKDTYRHLHRRHRDAKSQGAERLVIERLPEFEKYFASGADIDPAKIEPVLEEIDSDGWQTKLFRAASLTWSVPVSNGYGRRMRFLVWDKQNTKLIGLMALGDPVFNMGARDRIIGWNSADRENRLVNMMDAYVLGAIPPYNQLLGGKLIASLVRTEEISHRFKTKYGQTQGIISKEHKRAQLLCVTTTSSLGRSSIYNRLKLGGTDYFTSVGFTSGYGHFQIPPKLFEDVLSYLKKRRRSYADGHQFGDGPNWRMRAVRLALKLLDVNEEVLRHNLRREIFMCKYASNAYAYLCGHAKRARYDDLLPVTEVSALARNRWIVPRALRRPEFANWTREETLQLIRRDAAQVQEETGQLLKA